MFLNSLKSAGLRYLARNLTNTTNTTSSGYIANQPIVIAGEEEDKRAETDFGLIFDIDGVLVRGKTLLPATRECIKLITDVEGNFKVPTVFVTNAGNQLRSTKAAKLSNILGVCVKPEQMIMSHSPLKMLRNFHQKRVLISGQGPIVEIAKNLGFKNVVTMDDIRQHYPHLDVTDHKRRNFAPCVLGRYFPPIEAILLFGESIRWETNLQILIDVLMSNGKLDEAPKEFPASNLPILACNTDMIWMAEASMPRFGHGTFLHCLEQIFQKLSGRDLKYSAIVGKPSELTYYYAEEMLQNHAESIGANRNVKRLYAVGDNIDTDIYGANLFNRILVENNSFKENNSNKSSLIERKIACFDKTNRYVSTAESISSILVQTGVYQGEDVSKNLAHKDTFLDQKLVKPKFIANNVYEAVKLVFKLENCKFKES